MQNKLIFKFKNMLNAMLKFMPMNLIYWILVRPSIVPFTFGTEPIQARQFASVQCIVSSGDLPLVITWTFNGSPLQNSDLVSVSKSGQRISTLAIESVSERLAGNYTCVAENQAGQDTHTSLLKVNGLSTLELHAASLNV